jgi:murein DD-endopeptidase MepM/ murein hydrolase activator NlpD
MLSNRFSLNFPLWLILAVGLVCAQTPQACSLSLPTHLEVIDDFRAPNCVWCEGNRGIEYRPSPGGSVTSVVDGVVSFVGMVANTMYVVVRTEGGLLVTHGRLRSAQVALGESVLVGQGLGTAGTTLYIGVRRGSNYLHSAGAGGVALEPCRYTHSGHKSVSSNENM